MQEITANFATVVHFLVNRQVGNIREKNVAIESTFLII